MNAASIKNLRSTSARITGIAGALAVLLSGGCESQSAFEAYVYDQELLMEVGALNQSVQFVLENPDFVGRGDAHVRSSTQQLAISASSEAFSTLRELAGAKSSGGQRLQDFYANLKIEVADLHRRRMILDERIAQAVKQSSASLNPSSATDEGLDTSVKVAGHGS